MKKKILLLIALTSLNTFAAPIIPIDQICETVAWKAAEERDRGFNEPETIYSPYLIGPNLYVVSVVILTSEYTAYTQGHYLVHTKPSDDLTSCSVISIESAPLWPRI